MKTETCIHTRIKQVKHQYLAFCGGCEVSHACQDTDLKSNAKMLYNTLKQLSKKLTEPQTNTLEVMRNKDRCIDDMLIKSLADSWSLPKSVVESYLREHPPKTREPLTSISPKVLHKRSVAGGSIAM